MLRFNQSKHSSGLILGHLLLVLPLCSITISPSRVQAQPTLISPAKKKTSPLSPEQKMAFDKIMAVAHVQDICDTKIDLKMENATLEDVAAHIKQTFPTKNISIEIRGANTVHASFDLKSSSVGKILTPIAALARCKLYVFSTGLLISPPSQLTEEEKQDLQKMRGGEWTSESRQNRHRGWQVQTGVEPLSPEQKASKACSISMDLKVDNATLDDVITRIKQGLPDQNISLDIRGANPIRVSFGLKGTNVGNALIPIAALAGCQVYVLSSGVLITSPSQLTEAEKLELQKNQGGVWEDNIDAGEYWMAPQNAGPYSATNLRLMGWTVQREGNRLFSAAIAQEVTGSDPKTLPATSVKTSFGKFSSDSQAMLQQMADWIREGTRTVQPNTPFFHLNSDSKITVDTSDPESISISFNPAQSDQDVGSMIIKINQK